MQLDTERETGLTGRREQGHAEGQGQDFGEASVSLCGPLGRLLPTLKKPAEAIGNAVHVPGDFWSSCVANMCVRVRWLRS